MDIETMTIQLTVDPLLPDSYTMGQCPETAYRRKTVRENEDG